MTEQEIIERLHRLADDADARADEHLRRVNRGAKVYQQAEREAATADRGDALFLRQTAEAIDKNMPTTDEPVFDTVTG